MLMIADPNRNAESLLYKQTLTTWIHTHAKSKKYVEVIDKCWKGEATAEDLEHVARYFCLLPPTRPCLTFLTYTTLPLLRVMAWETLSFGKTYSTTDAKPSHQTPASLASMRMVAQLQIPKLFPTKIIINLINSPCLVKNHLI